MVILVAIISILLIADGVMMLFVPSFYRECLDFIDELIGPIWSQLYGVFFPVLAVFLLVSVRHTKTPLIFAGGGIILGLFGVFFLLSCTERFSFFNRWWINCPNWLLRLAGLAFIIFSGLIFQTMF